MTFPLPNIKIQAADKSAGMSLAQLEGAIRLARQHDVTRIVKCRVGFRGQIQSLEFGPHEAKVARA